MADQRHHQVQASGFWTQPQVTYSKETQNLMKEMMRESKLTNFQQRQLGRTLNGGGTLPLQCPPTHSVRAKPKPVPVPKNKPLNPKNCDDAGRRKKEEIEASGAYEREKFKPIPGVERTEKDKIRLANIMAYGEDLPPVQKSVYDRVPVEDTPVVDRFDELQQEIEERKNFLSQMEKIGKGKQYQTIIETEISQLIREMELLDKKRTNDLERLIQQKSK